MEADVQGLPVAAVKPWFLDIALTKQICPV